MHRHLWILLAALVGCQPASKAEGEPKGASTQAPATAAKAGANVKGKAGKSPVGKTTGATFQMARVVLYQPDPVLKTRLGTAAELAGYIKSIVVMTGQHFANAKVPEGLDIVVAVKPNRRARAWFVTTRPDGDASLQKLAKKIAAVRPPTVQKGPIAFAIIGSIAGGEPSKAGAGKNKPPMPKAWLRAAEKMSGKGVLPDDTLAILWPDRKPGAPPAAK